MCKWLIRIVKETRKAKWADSLPKKDKEKQMP